MAGRGYFGRGTFRFLGDLKANNDREWFAAHREQYEEHVREPALRFIEDFAKQLSAISPHFLATPRSLFRIHRDTRFSKDKSPYKTHTGIQFRHHRYKDAHAPGYYLHLEPGAVFLGLGIWHPDAGTLRAIRERIVEEPEAWKKASRAKGFSETFTLEGDRLSRPPKGFDPEHPLAEDLKWKDFIGVRQLTQAVVSKPGLPAELAGLCRAGTPMMRFLCEAVKAPF